MRRVLWDVEAAKANAACTNAASPAIASRCWQDTDNRNLSALLPLSLSLSLQFGRFYTGGNTTYLLRLTVLMETHPKAAGRQTETERGLVCLCVCVWRYFVTVLLLFSALTASPLSHISSPHPFFCRGRPKVKTQRAGGV